MQAVMETTFDLVYLISVIIIGIVLFASRIPLMGMLMIPKTCAYMWTVLIGYKAMRKEIK